jgi:formylglycine-generating enzyme required for sulfatase activity
MTAARVTAEQASLRLQVGGTLIPGRDIYIARPEDEQLLELLRNGEYVNILSSRQVGKSSLMLSAAFRLRDQGYRFAVVDLTALGTPADAGGYFRGLVGEIARQLGVSFAGANFWRVDAGTSSQQFIRFFREVVAKQIADPVVLFLDEIDSTLKLPYTDDLFTALRSMYNERAMVPAYQRIAVCLVGVATPDELIKDRRTTPYNVGRTLWLGDFDATRDDLAPLVAALSADRQAGSLLLERVLYWTGGHPFLTTRMCHDLRAAQVTSPAGVDRFVGERYATLAGLGEDVHVQQILRFVSERLSDGLASFNLYERILKGEHERDQPSLAHAELKLSGLVKRDRMGLLVPRNRIYQRLFNREWVHKSRPKRELTRARRVAYAAVAALVLAVSFGGVYYQTSVVPLEAQVVPLEQQLQARQELEKLQVTLTQGLRGFTEVQLPAQDTKRVLERALPYLQTLGSGGEGKGLALELSSLASFDPQVLGQLTALRRLVISGPKFSDLGFVARLPGLRELDVAGTAVSDLSPLAGLKDLEVLELSGTKVKDLRPLASLVKLRRLDLANTSVQDLAPLAGLKDLDVLELSGTAVKDLRPLASLANLRRLDLANTAVLELAPLAGLTRLEELDLSRTEVKSLASLKNLPALRHLALDGLDIRDFALAGRPGQIILLSDPQPVPVGVVPRAGQTFRDCPECPQMVVVPAGRFIMGSPAEEQGRDKDEGPPHAVSIPKAIAVGRYEVRFDEWALCVRDGACRAVPDAGFGRGARPVINVSYDDAQAYAQWLSTKSGKIYRLLSEAEWEYAARAGTSTARVWGEGPDQACAHANVADQTLKPELTPELATLWAFHNCSDGQPYSAPVGAYQPNAFGLYDMIGNVWEWVEDCYHADYSNVPIDGEASIKDMCEAYVVRGGGWFISPEDARPANRIRNPPGNRDFNLGFRLARTLP